MFASLGTQSFDLFEIHYQQISKAGQGKRIQRRICAHAGEIAQAKRLKLKLPPFFTGR